MSKMFFNIPATHAPRRSHGLTTLRLAVTTESPAEYGRIATTLHMLAFIDADETYRRRIHTQLNTQESCHALVRRIFHGKCGQLHQPFVTGRKTNSACSDWC